MKSITVAVRILIGRIIIKKRRRPSVEMEFQWEGQEIVSFTRNLNWTLMMLS